MPHVIWHHREKNGIFASGSTAHHTFIRNIPSRVG